MAIPKSDNELKEANSEVEPMFYHTEFEGESAETYILQTWISVANATESIKHIDDMTFMTTLKYPPEIRQKINKVRSWIKSNIDWFTIHFHGLKLTNSDGKASIETIITEGTKRLNRIDPSLNANCYAIPLDVSEIKDSQIKGDLVAAMMLEYVKEVVNIISKKQKLTSRAKSKIGHVRRKYKHLNLFQDDEFDTFCDAVTSELMDSELKDAKHWLADKIEGIDVNVSDSIKGIFKDRKDNAIADAVADVL